MSIFPSHGIRIGSQPSSALPSSSRSLFSPSFSLVPLLIQAPVQPSSQSSTPHGIFSPCPFPFFLLLFFPSPGVPSHALSLFFFFGSRIRRLLLHAPIGHCSGHRHITGPISQPILNWLFSTGWDDGKRLPQQYRYVCSAALLCSAVLCCAVLCCAVLCCSLLLYYIPCRFMCSSLPVSRHAMLCHAYPLPCAAGEGRVSGGCS